MKNTILDTILEQKRREVAARKEAVPMEHLLQLSSRLPEGRSLKEALAQSSTGIISEFKRKSPSKGFIYEAAPVEEVVQSYQQAGCTGISVLTDFDFFGGSMRDFKQARAAVDCPILRKDFMIDPYQIYESKVMGADVILLIASALSLDEAYDLGELAHALYMEVLLEVHNKEELEYISRFTDMVGVNNRNLKTFETRIETSLDLAEFIPDHLLKVSESGLSEASTLHTLRKAGYSGFLMGEQFMKTHQPRKALKELLDAL